jgi:hypothetical protein
MSRTSGSNLLVGIKLNLPISAPDVPGGQRKVQGTPPGFLQPALMHALLQDMQLGFAHRAF